MVTQSDYRARFDKYKSTKCHSFIKWL